MVVIKKNCLFIGVWCLKSSENMEEVLRLLGAGPCTTSMVSQSYMLLSLQEDVDYQWWVRYEYRLKGVTVNKMYQTVRQTVNKLTSNKFYLEQEKPDVLEDWDKR